MKTRLSLRINGEERDVLAETHKTLLEVLREDLNLTGTKHGCELGECGTCTVLVDGLPVLSCLALPVECQGVEIKTVEGMAPGGELHPLQQAFVELGAAQCGYCTPGILLTAEALLEETPTPTRDEIRHALAGNLCRCTGYTKILDAVELAALRMRRTGDPPQLPGEAQPQASRADTRQGEVQPQASRADTRQGEVQPQASRPDAKEART